MYACWINADLEIVKMLLDAGQEVNKTDNSGRTSFMDACRNGDLEVVVSVFSLL